MSRNGLVQVDVIQPTCPRCGGTKRSKYHGTQEHFNVTVRGVRYAKIKLRRTTCTECGQNRIERVLFQSKPKTSALRNKTEENLGDSGTDLKKIVNAVIGSAPCSTPNSSSENESSSSTPR